MRYPDVKAYEQPSLGLAEAYIYFIGHNSEQFITPPESIPRRQFTERASAFIGRGCMALAHPPHRKHQALENFRAAEESLVNHVNTTTDPSKAEKVQRQLEAINMLKRRREPAEVRRSRRIQHGSVIHELAIVKKALEDRPLLKSSEAGKLRSRANELTVLGLVGRLQHPWIAAWDALDYHEHHQGIPQNNFDVLLITSLPGDHEAGSKKIQVKSECIGLCKTSSAAGEQVVASRREVFAHYDSSVKLVSGCCDFYAPLETVNKHASRRSMPVAELLLREFNDDCSSRDQLVLDQVGNDLLLNITSDDRRRGEFVVPQLTGE